MPQELIKKCIDKKCTFSLMTGSETFTGVVKEIENYWILIKEDDCERLLNGVAVRDIKIIEE